MSNRVEDLERQVAELQAAVNGLTEELVEMKERVRQVEDAQEVSVEADAPGTDEPAEAGTEGSDEATESAEPSGGERKTHSDDHVDVVERTDDARNEAAGASGGVSETNDDMVVPEQEATTPDAEAAKSAESGDDGDDGESSDSDIIVA